ncbi:MAG: hypothetical protein HC780_22995 [Leptolyngbyaceae cyanobacterium CSU_1_3]|nr:hypothetical protein [Leptolyngbyaceae cyanobacterium CSU_1_3]
MQKFIFSLSLAIGLTTLTIGQAAIAQQTTTRTGPYGNTLPSNRSVNNGVQTTTRTGPKGNSAVTNRSVNNGVQTTTRTGPYGNTQTTQRSISH